MKQRITVFLFIFFLSPFIHSLSVFTAPVAYYTDESNEKSKHGNSIQDKITGDLAQRFAWSKIRFLKLKEEAAPPQSFMDALHLSNEFSLDYIIYGFIEENDYSLHGELKLFDGKKQEIIRVFYSTDNTDKINRLIDDLVSKIEEYFKSIFNMPLPGGNMEAAPSHGIISFLFGAGYWTTVTSGWNEYNLGLYSIDLHTRFIPTRPPEGSGFRGFYFRTGLAANFFHSINRTGYEKYHLFTFTFGLPAALCADIGIKHTVSLSLEPEFSIDYLIQERMYDDTVMIPSVLFSVAVNPEYQYFITPRFLTGISNRVSLTFTEPVRIIYNPLIHWEFRLKPLSQRKSGGKP